MNRLMRRLARCCGIGVAYVVAAHGQTSVLTWHNDNARTGQTLQETILMPSNVNATTFGRLATITLDGKVDAQPLYVPSLTIPGQGTHNVLYVASEADSLYAFDADTSARLLQVTLLGTNEVPSDDHGCGQVTPTIGITATPVIDPQAGPHGTIYVISLSKDSTGHYHHRLHALDLTTFAEEFGGPVEIKATFPGAGAENTFNPAVHTERPGLLLLNGIVYTSWGSHCDGGSYAGWVIGYNQITLAQAGVLNLEPNGNDGGIWAAGSGPAADANGNIYVLTGNGTFDTTLTDGFPAQGDYGNSFVKISTAGLLAVSDYFTMSNTVSESNSDTDLGSAGLILLPPLNDSQGNPVSLAVGAGKDRNIYVVNRMAMMGEFNSGSDAIFQQLSGALPNGTWSSPAWFNGTLYYGGNGDHLKAFSFSRGQFSLASQSSTSFPFPGTTPSISANGTSNAIVWAIENSSPAVLHAYDATNVATELYNSNQAGGGRDQFGNGNKYIVPTIANGRVYAGTTTGVGVFGLLAGSPLALTTNVAPAGAGGVTPVSGMLFTPGSVVNLQATPSPGYSFANWTGNVTSPGSASTTITMTSAQTVTANFVTVRRRWVGPIRRK